ncbi:MAG: hypothetical protein JO244_14835 [Solirubrobacterales bacterium]|nr:hypothetical protein [Solirubrobacterales bacterium]
MCRLAAGLFAAALLWAQAAHACSVCGCGDPLVLAGDSMPVAGTFRFALEYEYLTATARSDDQPDRTEALTQMTLRPVLVYSPFDRLTLVLQVPLVRKDWSLSATSVDAEETATPTGLGDIDFGVRVFLWDATSIRDRRRQNFALTAGTSFPTGADDTTVDGERIDQHAQLGTGAWGPYVGALYAFHQDPWNFLLSVSGRFRTENSYQYKFGDSALWSAQLAFRVAEPLAFRIGLDGHYAARDRSEGVLQENTGGLVVSAVPGVSWNFAGPLWLLAQVQIPFATHLFGQQTVGVTATASIQYVLK